MQITNETTHRISEFVKCKDDFFYFAEKYIKIPLAGGSILPKLYGPQKEFIKILLEDHYTTLLKTRQTGGSTSAQMYCVWACTFFKNVVIAVVSRKGDEATDFARKVMMMIRELPSWMMPKFQKETERTFILDNGCQLFADSVNPKNPGGLFRGKAISIAIIDEAAHIDMIDKAYTGFAPALFKAHKSARETGNPYALMVISTPNRTVGIGKWYYDMWVDANSEGSLFKPIKLYWRDIPDFLNDPAWYSTQCRILNNDAGKIAQELEMQFLGSEDSWLPMTVIEKLQRSITPPVSKIKMKGGYLHQWVELDINKFYIIGIDTATSSGGDKSGVEIFEYESMNQCAEYQGKLEVYDFCEVIKTICNLYPKNLLVPENNSIANEVIGYLRRADENYNIYRSKTDIAKQNTKNIAFGINTNVKTRPLIMDSLYAFVTQFPECIRSERLILELVGLVEKVATGASRARVEADRGMNDDLVLSLAFGTYVRQYDPPMSIPTVKNLEAQSNIMQIAGEWNDDSLVVDKNIVGTPYYNPIGDHFKGLTLQGMNNELSKKIKEGLFEMQEKSGLIDIFTILKMND
jgi:hypothetical protein